MTVFLVADANRLASNEEETCTSTGGLAALGGAAPDTNRAAGLHSHFVAPMAHSQSVELACYRSDLLKASWIHVWQETGLKVIVRCHKSFCAVAAMAAGGVLT